MIHFLIDFGQQFTADVFLPRRLAAHQPARSRNDIDTVPTEHARDFVRADIYPATGPRHSRQMRNRGSAPRIVTQEDAHRLLCALALDDAIADVAFLFE